MFITVTGIDMNKLLCYLIYLHATRRYAARRTDSMRVVGNYFFLPSIAMLVLSVINDSTPNVLILVGHNTQK